MNTEVMFSSKTDQWSTPQDFFDKLNEEFHFTLDPCADEFNHKCEKYYTKEDDGLIQSWEGETVFCNPPYGNKETGLWTKKCYEESLRPNTTVVLLIPARTDRISFHEYIYGKAEIRFIKGRLRFGDGKDPAPFPSMVVVFKGKKKSNVVDSIIDGCIEECGGVEEMIRTYEDARAMLKTAEKEGTDFSKCKTFSELCIHGAISSIGKMFKTE